MIGYNFTDRVRRALQRAREEARRLGHEHVGTEHVLLGVIQDDDGVASSVLDHFHVNPEDLRRQIAAQVERGKATALGPDMPYTRRAKMVLELAIEEARNLGHGFVGTEHLLLGLIREEKGVAARVLMTAGLALDVVRAEVLRLEGSETPAAPGPDPRKRRAELFARGTSLVDELSAQPSPDTVRVRQIAHGLRVLLDELWALQ